MPFSIASLRRRSIWLNHLGLLFRKRPRKSIVYKNLSTATSNSLEPSLVIYLRPEEIAVWPEVLMITQFFTILERKNYYFGCIHRWSHHYWWWWRWIFALKKFLSKQFQITNLAKLKYFLGIAVLRSHDKLMLYKRKYVLDMLTESGLLGFKPVDSLMIIETKLMSEDGEHDPERYHRLAGKLNI